MSSVISPDPLCQKFQSEILIEKHTEFRHRIFQNRLLLVSLINCAIFLVFIFAMSFYQWAYIQIKIVKAYQKSTPDDLIIGFWANFLYVKEDGHPEYRTYEHLSKEYCDSSDVYCLAVFYEFAFVGGLCFGVTIVAVLIQIYDIITILHYIFPIVPLPPFHDQKDYFRHYLTILSFVVGLTLSIFGYMMINPLTLRYGASFWVFVAALAIFVIIVIYEQIEVKNVEKQKMVLQLISKQRQVREAMNQSIEMSSENDHAI